MADKLLDDAAAIINAQADALYHRYYIPREERWKFPKPQKDFVRLCDIAAQLEARSNSSDHSDRGAKEAG